MADDKTILWLIQKYRNGEMSEPQKALLREKLRGNPGALEALDYKGEAVYEYTGNGDAQRAQAGASAEGLYGVPVVDQGIADAYHGIGDKKMTPAQKAEFDRRAKAGEFRLPDVKAVGGDVELGSAPPAPKGTLVDESVVEAYHSPDKMTAEQKAEFEERVKSGELVLPKGAKLTSDVSESTTKAIPEIRERGDLSPLSPTTRLAISGTEPEETLKIIKKQHPDVTVFKDEKGNNLYYFPQTNQFLADKPGITPGKIDDFFLPIAAAAAIPVAGIAGAALLGAGVKAAQEGLQSSKGGDFSVGQVALHGAAGGLGAAVAKGAGALVSRLAGRGTKMEQLAKSVDGVIEKIGGTRNLAELDAATLTAMRDAAGKTAAAAAAKGQPPEIAKALGEASVTMQQNMARIFGQDLERSMLEPMSEGMKELGKQQVQGWVRFMRAIPEKMRARVTTSALGEMVGKPFEAGAGGQSVHQFVNWWNKVRKTPELLSAFGENLPPGAIGGIDALAGAFTKLSKSLGGEEAGKGMAEVLSSFGPGKGKYWLMRSLFTASGESRALIGALNTVRRYQGKLDIGTFQSLFARVASQINAPTPELENK